MTEIELIDKIKERNKVLEKELKEENKEEEFYTEFLKNNKYNTFENMSKIDLCDIMIALFRINDQTISIEEVQEKIYNNKILIENLDANNFDKIYIGLAMLYDTENLSVLNEILNLSSTEKDRDKKLRYLTKQIVKKSPENMIILTEMTRILKDIDCDFTGILDLAEINPEAILDAFDMALTIKSIKDSLNDYNVFSVDVDEQNKEMPREMRRDDKKIKKEVLNAVFNEKYNLSLLNEDFNSINEYYRKIHNEELKRKRAIRKEINNNDEFLTTFKSAIARDEITNFNKIISYLSDEKMRLEVLKLIYEHNKVSYETLETTYNELSNNSKARYQVLLNQIGLDQDKYKIEVIMQKPYDEVEQMVTTLTKMGIKDQEALAVILETSNLERVNEVYELLDEELISQKTAIKYSTIFDVDKSTYQQVINNIKLFNKYNINPYYLENSQSTLLLDPNAISKNLEILKEYKLLNCLNQKINYKFLGREDLEEQIDEILELGHENNLIQNMDLLNISKERWQRIQALKSVNVPVTSYEELINNLTTNKFLIPDQSLHEYIYNVVPYRIGEKLSQLPSLQSKDEMFDDSNFDKTKRTYNINGTIISKNKAKRNYSKVKDLDLPMKEKILISLVSGSILSENEYENIRKKSYQKVNK